MSPKSRRDLFRCAVAVPVLAAGLAAPAVSAERLEYVALLAGGDEVAIERFENRLVAAEAGTLDALALKATIVSRWFETCRINAFYGGRRLAEDAAALFGSGRLA